MILSHTDTDFPYRRQLLTAAVGIIALTSVLVPSENLLQRFVAPLKVILIGAVAYGAVMLILHIFGSFVQWFAKFYALFCYYVGILGLVLTPIIMAFDPGDSESGPTAFASAEYFSLILPQMAAGICAAAAAYTWMRPHHVA